MKLEKTAPKLGNVTMNNGWTWPVLIIGLIVFILGMWALAVNAAVIAVYDGDTIAYNGEKIRLFGIDAPEKNQPGGAEARTFLAQQISGKELRIVRKDTDRYGRTVAIVFAGNRSVNAAMVEAGWAWSYREYSTSYVAHEERARRAGRGLWAVACPVAPWQYRNN